MPYPIADKKAVTMFVQGHLADLELYTKKIDGYPGKFTRRAIKEFAPEWRLKDISKPGTSRLLAGAVQTLANQAGHKLEVDFWWGPNTEAVFDTMEENEMPDRVLEDRTTPGVAVWAWPSMSLIRTGRSIFGRAGTNLATLKAPYDMEIAWQKGRKVSTLYAHKLVHEALAGALEEVRDTYGLTAIRDLGLDQYGGIYNNRSVRGGRKKSMHAWGIAMDVDPANNRLKMDHREARFADPQYDRWFEIWESFGAVGLGPARNYDWMHTQFARLG